MGIWIKIKYLTVNIKQKKAIKDKSKGSTLIAYNKKAEIANSSDKTYINSHYNNPAKLHRLEVHLNNDEVERIFEPYQARVVILFIGG